MMKDKPIIETMINSVALALTSYGVVDITVNLGWLGYVAIASGVILEWFKYWGRGKKLW